MERGKKVDAHSMEFTQGSAQADYLTRRIARHHPDILERMKAGEFSSVRQATAGRLHLCDAGHLAVLGVMRPGRRLMSLLANPGGCQPLGR